MDRDELDKFLDEIFDKRNQVTQSHGPLFPQRDYVVENLIAKSKKRLEKNYKPKPPTRKLRESPPGSSNYQ